tara:strand:- start:772 stop:1056 length:285 start_codon:yes stop_codon:yes gene_type:complete
MNFKPANRYIMVKPIEQNEKKQEDLAYVLPTDYKKPESPHLLCEVLDAAPDSKFKNSLKTGDKIIIERRMLNKIEIEGSEIYLVLDNYLFGRLY